ncbi:hypothetical protein PoB_006206200 [Plakobranchus ocellatus]|uniref:Uncharacterized protein n=1 Tax=Plakobranchus ocellatus TaxID=259542 RepID=A0AAV4CUG6_9GAST|nr:hypothetical protein PoB_006206200 [Plakobranchus ocellatus]
MGNGGIVIIWLVVVARLCQTQGIVCLIWEWVKGFELADLDLCRAMAYSLSSPRGQPEGAAAAAALAVAGQNAGQNSQSHVDGADLFDLQHKVKSLEAKLQEKAEELRQQAASLHEHHRDKMAALRARHQGEITTLQAEVAALEQRLADARDGTSGSQHSGSTSGSTNLPEAERLPALPEDDTLKARLDTALRDKKKAEDARIHLESTLEELQREVEDLQAKNEALESSVGKVEELSAGLTESESARHSLEQELTQVRAELVRTKHRLLDQLDANHVAILSFFLFLFFSKST